MTPFIFLGASIVLFIAYFGFTVVEAKTGARVLHGTRSRLDRIAVRAEFIFEHVDWVGFLKDVIASVSARLAHDVVHATLVTVRVMERELTRLMRVLRNRRPVAVAPRSSRVSPLSQTVAYVRNLLHSNKDRD